ncbi:MAG: hypothetical protein ABSF64_18040 [Bryobacteraceae bacterium]|jgi:hypothetical protein
MADSNGSSMSFGLGFLGFLLGGVIGFLLRPSATLIGQLPFRTVITRGANLSGLERLLVPTAQTSFNAMLVGAIIGAVAGVVAGRSMGGKRG